MMQKSTWLILSTLLGVMQSNAHAVDSTFHNVVCQQCNSWCSARQTVRDGRRIGKSGPRGPPGRPGAVGPEGGQGVAGPRGEKGNPGLPAVVNMTALEELIEIKVEEVLIRRLAMATYSSCRAVNLAFAKSQNETGGVFNITIPGVGKEEVYCNTEIDGGGWIVFQRRMDGSVDFDRNWEEYVAGFGNAEGEYWLGLEAIHQLTKNGGVELRIDMIEQNGNYYYAKYRNFHIAPGSDNYRLNLTGYSGNATNALTPTATSLQWTNANGVQFSTFDADHDLLSSSNCAAQSGGGWWHNACSITRPNGRYNGTDYEGVTWKNTETNELPLMKFVEMKIKKRS